MKLTASSPLPCAGLIQVARYWAPVRLFAPDPATSAISRRESGRPSSSRRRSRGIRRPEHRSMTLFTRLAPRNASRTNK